MAKLEIVVGNPIYYNIVFRYVKDSNGHQTNKIKNGKPNKVVEDNFIKELNETWGAQSGVIFRSDANESKIVQVNQNWGAAIDTPTLSAYCKTISLTKKTIVVSFVWDIGSSSYYSEACCPCIPDGAETYTPSAGVAARLESHS